MKRKLPPGRENNEYRRLRSSRNRRLRIGCNKPQPDSSAYGLARMANSYLSITSTAEEGEIPGEPTEFFVASYHAKLSTTTSAFKPLAALVRDSKLQRVNPRSAP